MTEIIPARGFGPGLPAEGAPVSIRVSAERLHIDGWPGISVVRKGQAQSRQQGNHLLLEWQSPDGACALSVDRKSALLAWLPASTPRHDAATRGWLWAILFITVGLPLLLLAAFVGFRAEIVDAALARIPVEQEKRLAEQLWKLQRVQLNLIEGTAANRFLDEVGARLVAAKPTPYDYHFHLTRDRSINAFAMPAGYVVINRGLIDKAATAEEVAGVLAHEIEHVEQRHSLRGMIQATGLAAIWATVSGDIAGGATGAWLKNLAGLRFSREQETAADAGGYARLLAAAIDPHGMASFFDRLARNQTDQPGLPDVLNMLSTHPSSAERAAALKTLLKDAPALPPLGGDWSAVQASLPR